MSDTQPQDIQREIKIVEDGAPKAQSPLETFVEHQKRALEETGKAIEALLPDGFKEHSKEAGKEFAKGLKVLVDAAVSEVEKASRELDKQFRARQQQSAAPTDESERPSSTGAQKVKVQVD
ncbi:MAG: hypothetical protein SF162_10990 [bacterium]|nr:hypothetical protein [bacterium]